MHRHIRAIVAASAAATLLGGASPALAGLSGAIFTTNVDGSWVNGNVYDSKTDVYLNGGPRANQKCTAAGLPDGQYYFQVTDPSGKVLLSTDDVEERRVRVENGVIAEYLGATHVTGVGRCGGVTVAVADPPETLLDTPNPGGEYKVWLTPVESYACTDPATFCGGAFGFVPSSSKTDNFKVQAPGGDPGGDGD